MGTFGSGTFGSGTFGGPEPVQVVDGGAVDFELAFELVTTGLSASFILAWDFVLDAPDLDLVGDSTSALISRPPLGMSSPTGMSIDLWGEFELEASEQYSGVGPVARAQEARHLVVVTPAIVMGRPRVPTHWLQAEGSSVTGQFGAGKIEMIEDPEPTVYVPPGSFGQAVAGDHRWLASDCPLNNEFMDSWPAKEGGVPFVSVFPYRPKLRPPNQYGDAEKTTSYANGVYFNPEYVEHMWANLGAVPQPYTWVICAALLSYPRGDYTQHLLDLGVGQPAGHTIAMARTDRGVNDHVGNRATMAFGRDTGFVSTNMRMEDGVYVRVPHAWAPRPRVYAAVFNGADSIAMSADSHSKDFATGTVSAGAGGPFIVGRKTGILSDNFSSQMLIFELRLFKRALTKVQLEQNYDQLASSYSFGRY